MTKIWGEVFWKPAPRADTGDEVSLAAGPSGWMMTPIAGLVILTVIIGFGAEAFVEIALKAAEELLHPEMYLKAVLGA
jgi:multicomponent Na+:H+ antiporter subunit D